MTFARDYGMNLAVVDLDPGPLGRIGQILTHGRDVRAPAEYVAASITDLLRHAITTLDDERPPAPAAEFRVDAVADAPITAQGVVLRTDAPIRLSDFDVFHNLRSLAVRRSAAQIGTEVPIERLSVEATHGEIVTLPPTSLDLTLSGNETPSTIIRFGSPSTSGPDRAFPDQPSRLLRIRHATSGEPRSGTVSHHQRQTGPGATPATPI